jgi:hypothetical protein
MALQRKIPGPAAAIERRPPIAIRPPSGAAVTAPPASLLRQRVGNKASQVLLSRGPSPSGGAVGESRIAAGPAAPDASAGEKAAPAQKKAGAAQPESKPPESQAAPDVSAAPAAAKKAPKTPQQDPAFQKVIGQTRKARTDLKKSQPPETKKRQITDAAHLSTKEQSDYNDRKSHLETINETAASHQDVKQNFTAAQFKSLLETHLQTLEQKLPHSEAEARRFKNEKPLEQIKDNVSREVRDQNQKVAAPITAETGRAEPPKSGFQPTVAKDLMEEKAGAKPKAISPAAAAPKPLDDSEISLEKESQSLDELMAKNNNTEEQFAESNEPKFKKALTTKKEAQEKAAAAPGQYRGREHQVLAAAQGKARAEGSSAYGSMYGTRDAAFGSVFQKQKDTTKDDKSQQAAVKTQLEGIYNATKTEVEKIFTDLSEYVDTTFNTESTTAKTAFEKRVEDQLGDIHGWGVKDFFFGEDTEAIEAVFAREKQRFLTAMDRTLNKIAQRIADDLNKAVNRIKQGEKDAETFYGNLDKEQQRLSADAMDTFRIQFQNLQTSVDEKQTELVQSLAESYKESRGSLRATFDKINEDVKKNWIQRAAEFIKEVALTIYRLGELLVTVLVRIANLVGEILAHPIRFLENLAAGIKQGFKTFADNFDTYLLAGFFDWLKGKVGTSIKLPPKFDTAGLFSLALQVIGLTYDNFRRIAADKLGEPAVSAFEKGVEGAQEIYRLFQMARTDIGALWTHIKDVLATQVDEIFTKIKETVLYETIKKVLVYIVTLFNPVGAFIKAAQAIYAGIRFLMDNIDRIVALVNAFLDGVEMAVKGNVGGIASKVITGLQNAIVLGIDFLAKLLGLGNLDDKVRAIIKRLSTPVERAMGFVVDKVIKPAAKLLVKAGKSILEWWKKRKRFKAGGETHEVYFTGTEKSAQLMVASDPRLVSSFVNKAEAAIKPSDPNKAKKLAAIKAINAALAVMTREGVKSAEKQDKKAIVSAFEIVGDNLPVLMEFNEDDDRVVGDIDVERPQFSEKVRNLLVVNADKEDRRHIVSSQDMAEHYEKSLRKKKMWEAAKLLLERGQPIQKPLSDKKIEAAAKQRHKRFFSDVHNLFIGDLTENRSLGRTVDPKPGMGPKKLKDHIEYIKGRWALVPDTLKVTGM